MGPLHPSDSISLPFESVVFVAIATTNNRGCWLHCSLGKELLSAWAEKMHRTQAAQRAPDLIRHVSAVLTWTGTDSCPRDGLTDFMFWISVFSSTLLYCCFCSPADVYKQETSISWRRKKLGRKFCSQNKMGWQRKNATERGKKKQKTRKKNAQQNLNKPCLAQWPKDMPVRWSWPQPEMTPYLYLHKSSFLCWCISFSLPEIELQK